jgi:hypothetical protein
MYIAGIVVQKDCYILAVFSLNMFMWVNVMEGLLEFMSQINIVEY